MLATHLTVTHPSTGWLIVFGLIAVVALVLAAFRVREPSWVAWFPLGVLAAVIIFFWQALAVASQRGAVTFDADWWAARKKATAAFLTVAVAEVTALLSFGVLPDPWSTHVASVLVAAGPLLAFLGVKAAPANKKLT